MPKSQRKSSRSNKKKLKYNEQDIIQSIEWVQKSKNGKLEFGAIIAKYQYDDGEKATESRTLSKRGFRLAPDILKDFWNNVGTKQSQLKPGQRVNALSDFEKKWALNTDQAILDALKEEAKAASLEEKAAAEKRATAWARKIKACDTSRSASPQVDNDEAQDAENTNAEAEGPKDVNDEGTAGKSKKSRKRPSNRSHAPQPLDTNDGSDTETGPKNPRSSVSDRTPKKRGRPSRNNASDENEDSDPAPMPKKPRKSLAV